MPASARTLTIIYNHLQSNVHCSFSWAAAIDAPQPHLALGAVCYKDAFVNVGSIHTHKTSKQHVRPPYIAKQCFMESDSSFTSANISALIPLSQYWCLPGFASLANLQLQAAVLFLHDTGLYK